MVVILPFEDLEAAARDHLRGTLGKLEGLARFAEFLAIRKAGRIAGFVPALVSPVQSSPRLSSRVAFITGDADSDTPLAGVRRVARVHPDLTVIHGAGHCQASNFRPGGWEAWARVRLEAWGL